MTVNDYAMVYGPFLFMITVLIAPTAILWLILRELRAIREKL